MNNAKSFKDELFDEARTDITDKSKEFVKSLIYVIFDYAEKKVKDIPQVIEQIRNNPKVEQEISALWSEHLFKEGLVPKGDNGLPDDMLISNFHQEGYLSGLYIGYILAMMALVDNDISEDKIISVRDYIRPYLMRNYYKNSDEFIVQYKDEKYCWIEEK